MRGIMLAVGLVALAPVARADQIVVLSAAAVRAPLEAARDLAVAATGNGLRVSFGTAGAIRDTVAAGEPADIVVLPPARLDELVQRSLVLPGHVDLGAVRLGVAVRAGAARPAIATETDVRAALLAAPSIGLADPASGATTGLYFATLLKQLGLDQTLAGRIELFPDGTAAMEALARGEVAIAAGQISEIKPVAGVDLVGPFPEALQLRTVYAAAVAKTSHAPDAARAMIAFLTSDKVAPAFAAAGYDAPIRVGQGDYPVPSFRFESGELMPSLRLHYPTLGTPRLDAAGHVTDAVLTPHGTTGTGHHFLIRSIADVLFGPGQRLDASRYYIIMTDGIGRGGSSKPSDGLLAKCSHYGYIDLVEAQYALVVDGLHIEHLSLVLGTSMGGMHAWLWGERYPTLMSAIMAVASQPVAVTGRNSLWRDLIGRSIRGDPDWHGGEYATEPAHFQAALPLFSIMTGPARAREDGAIGDCDPEPALDTIAAPVVAVDFADDLLNAVALGTMARLMPRVGNGRYVIVPEGPDTIGHQSLTQAKLWAPYLADLMNSTR